MTDVGIAPPGLALGDVTRHLDVTRAVGIDVLALGAYLIAK